MTNKLGRLANNPNKPRLKLSTALVDRNYSYPESVDYFSRVASFPMYLNNELGDCTCATMGHVLQSVTTYGNGETVTVSDEDVLAAYEAVSGYDPDTKQNDNGAIEQEVLNYWRKTGIAGHKILAFAEVDIHDKAELRAAMNIFGALYLGINFPDSAMEQFNNSQPWTPVDGAVVQGGHAINAGYYDNDTWKIVTWGKVQEVSNYFMDKYLEEAWVVITPEWFNEQGSSPTGLNLEELGAQFTSMTGEASPFLSITPNPAPPTKLDESVLFKLLNWLINLLSRNSRGQHKR